MRTNLRHLAAASLLAASTSVATADITGVYVVRYQVTAEDFGGGSITTWVEDLYLSSDDAADTVLNIYNLALPDAAKVAYYQSFTSTGWLAQNAGGIFDNAALRQADSFVTIGGFAQGTLRPEQVPAAGEGSGLDPNFGGNSTPYPGEYAGWYNGSPPSLNGQVGDVARPDGSLGLGVLIGRFAFDCPDTTLAGVSLNVTWNQGLGSSGQQGRFENLGGGSPFEDCNDNLRPDSCDISNGLSTDYNGNGIPDECEGGLVGTDYATIAEGLLAAPDGGVVRVPAGTYDEAIELDRAVTLLAIDGPESTVLTRTGGLRSIVTANGAPTGATIAGFTITNGANFGVASGGGIDAIDSDLLVDNCIIEFNGGTEGGGARFEGGAPILRNCIFRGNTAQGLGGGLRLATSDATVDTCVFESNVAADASVGWAISSTDGFPVLIDVEASFHDGQPVAFESPAAFPNTRMVASGLFIHDNDGTGIRADTNDPRLFVLSESRICGNLGQAISGAIFDDGGNILFDDRCPDLVVPDDADSIALAAAAAADGDRIAVRPGDYNEQSLDLSGRDLELVGVNDLFLGRPTVLGTIDASFMPETALLRDLVIEQGSGVLGVSGYEGLRVGGGLVLENSAALVERCDIRLNQAALGGGIFVRGGAARLTSVVVGENQAVLGGGGMHVEGDDTTVLDLSDCTIGQNQIPLLTSTRGGGMDARGLIDSTSLRMTDTDIAENARENLAIGGSFTDLGGNLIALAEDCDGNGIEDAADIGDLGRPDCDGNLVPDDCDIADGVVADCDGNGIPDACDLGYDEQPRYRRHDGVSEKAAGAVEAGTLAWLEGFTARDGLEEIRSITVTFGEDGLSPSIIGQPAEICLWSDPDGDGTPNDATLLSSTTAFIRGPLGQADQIVDLPTPVSLPPDASFFVGVVMIVPENAQWYPAAIDDDGGSPASWIARDTVALPAADIGTASSLERLIETDPKFAQSRWMLAALPTLQPGAADCDANGLIDVCEIATGTSVDCDGNGLPDVCDLGYVDAPRYERHDRSPDKAEGAVESGTLAWLERFTAREDFARIASIEVTFGETGLSPSIIGQPAEICLWSDPDGDGTPNDATPLLTTTTIIEGPLGTRPQVVDLPSSVDVAPGSNFFVGVVMIVPENAQWYPAAIDDSGVSFDSWIARDAATLDPAEIGTAGTLSRLPSVDPKFGSSRWMISAVPDLGTSSLDCNANGLIDACETAEGTTEDCNDNGVPDDCDLAAGIDDVNLDGILDSCQGQLVFEVPSRFESITSAIDAAPEGSRIQLAPGNYLEAIDLGSKNLEILGDPADPASTTIETPGLGLTVVTIAGGQDASTLIAGVLIENGIGSTPEPGSPFNLVGGGLYVDGSSPTIEDCIIGTNQAAKGGGAYLRFSDAVFRRTVFEGNTANAGAGIAWNAGTITLEECMIRSNNAVAGDGGGLLLIADAGSIVSSSISDNQATEDGAGLWWRGSVLPLVLDQVSITGNIANTGRDGGGIYCVSDQPGIQPDGLTACGNFPDQIHGPYTILPGVSNDVCRCGDLNGDGRVDGVDLGLYLAVGGLPCPEFQDCPADVTFDGEITGADLGRILGDWGFCP